MAYPLSVVLSNSDGLVFGNVNNFDKLHIRSVGRIFRIWLKFS